MQSSAYKFTAELIAASVAIMENAMQVDLPPQQPAGRKKRRPNMPKGFFDNNYKDIRDIHARRVKKNLREKERVSTIAGTYENLAKQQV